MYFQTEINATPTAPGASRVFVANFLIQPPAAGNPLQLLFNPKKLAAKLLMATRASLPAWRMHLFSNKLFDQDGVFLAMQDRLLRKSGWCDAQSRGIRLWLLSVFHLKNLVVIIA